MSDNKQNTKPAEKKPTEQKPAKEQKPKEQKPEKEQKKKKTEKKGDKKKVKKGEKKVKDTLGKSQKIQKPEQTKEAYKHLFIKRPRNFTIGNDLPPKLDLTRFVKWPKYVKLQRQRRVLIKRLRIPPAINQFSLTANKHLALQVFKFLNKYRPEDKRMKRERLRKIAALKKEGKEIPKELETKPPVVHYGLNRVVSLIERKKATLVVLAHDVDPIELVVYIPALCKKMGIPYCIIKGKSRLGQLVHKKTATCVCLTDVRKEDKAEYDKLLEVVKGHFNDKFNQINRKWGGGKLSRRSLHAQQVRLNKA